jgi:dipeptidyl aminopeptidase/acylaminoacyl peptidase
VGKIKRCGGVVSYFSRVCCAVVFAGLSVAIAQPMDNSERVSSPDPATVSSRDHAGLFLDFLESSARYSSPSLSPSGRYLAYFDKHDPEGHASFLMIFDLDDAEAPPQRAGLGDAITHWVDWASDDRLLLALEGRAQENQRRRRRRNLPAARVISTDRAALSGFATLFGDESQRMNNSNRNLTRIVDMIPDEPDFVLMPAYRNSRRHLWKVNIVTGEAEVVEQGSRRTIAWYAVDGEAVMRLDVSRNWRRFDFYTRTGRDGRWRRSESVTVRDTEDGEERDFQWAGSTGVPGEIFVRARPEGENFFGIYRYDLETGEYLEAIATRDDYDIATSLIDSWSGEMVGYGYVADRLVYQYNDTQMAAHYEGILEFFGDQAVVRPVSASGSRMLLDVRAPTEPGTVYLYDFAQHEVSPVYNRWPAALNVDLGQVEALHYQSRDGLDLTGYLTLPDQGIGPDTPLIVYPHGGPELRDRVSFYTMPQYFAHLGYAVFQPNFRGSSGYGLEFMEAGHHQWGLAMQDDITDGVRHLIETGRVNPERICIVGFSYGGYAALAGATMTPDLYSCAIAGGAVTDLPAFLESKTEFLDGVLEYWVDLLGDPELPTDAERLRVTSPINLAANVTVPLLLFHGEHDDRVPVEQARSMSQALDTAGISHVYIEEERGWHDWGAGEENYRWSLLNIEAFLADAIDGSLDEFVAVPQPAIDQ